MCRTCVPTEKGFSLIELVATVAVLGTLLAIGVPQFSATIKNSRLTATANDVVASMQLARSEAVKRRTNVVVCHSNNALGATPSCGGSNWGDGWLAFADVNGNNSFESGTDALLRQAGPAGANVELVASSATPGIQSQITYVPTGFTTLGNAPIDQRSLLLCDDRADNRHSRVVSVSRTGRAGVFQYPESGVTGLNCSP